MKVLVADDDASIRMLVRTTVQELGHEVVVAAGGLEAWDRLSAWPAQVVVLDWVMPDLDGLELCRRIRGQVAPAYTYVILLTALDAESHYLTAIDAGVDDFLTKPFDPALLGARLRVAERILGLRRHVSHLEKLLPICMHCKKIRDDTGQWVRVEDFVERETSRHLTHGICDQCYTIVARSPVVRREP